MKYKSEILTMMNDDYEAFCKALFCIERSTNDVEQLEKMYQKYIETDGIELLNTDIQ